MSKWLDHGYWSVDKCCLWACYVKFAAKLIRKVACCCSPLKGALDGFGPVVVVAAL